MLYDYIITNYQKDEPIFLAELPGKSRESIRQEMKKLTDEGKIADAIRDNSGFLGIDTTIYDGFADDVSRLAVRNAILEKLQAETDGATVAEFKKFFDEACAAEKSQFL